MTTEIPVSRTGATDREVEAGVRAYLGHSRVGWDQLGRAAREGNIGIHGSRVRAILDAARAAAAPDEDPRIAAVLALHSPVEWFEWKDGVEGVPDSDKPLGSFCRACTDPDLVAAVEGDGLDASEGGLVSWPCPTAALLAEQPGGGR